MWPKNRWASKTCLERLSSGLSVLRRWSKTDQQTMVRGRPKNMKAFDYFLSNKLRLFEINLVDLCHFYNISGNFESLESIRISIRASLREERKLA